MTDSYTVAKRGLSRVFIIEGRARPDHEPDYEGCMIAGGIDQSLGDVTPIKCPSPDSFGRWDEVGSYQGEQSRPTTSLTSLYPLDIVSVLERLKRLRCPYDVHINFGACSDPTDDDTFKKKVIFEDSVSTSYGTDELGAMSDADESQINETTDVSGAEFYSVVYLTVQERGGDTVVNPLNDVVICARPECGDCDEENDGCQYIYAVGASSPGSPGTAPDLVYSTDGAATLNADDINSLDSGETGDALACVGLYVVVVSNDDGGIHYKLKSTINDGTAGGWTRNATNVVTGGEPNDIWSVGTYAFIVGDGGYIYGLANPVAGVVVLDAAEATTNNLLAVHALSKYFAVAVGASGTVVRTEDQTTWSTVTAPGAKTLQCVWCKNKRHWWVGASDGTVYYTLDGGDTWTEFTNFPVTLTNVEDIAFGTDSVGYLGGYTSNLALAPEGVMLRTYNGGYSWVSMPEGIGTFPASDEVTAIAACVYDPNFVVGVGMADDAADGFYVIGSATG